MPQDIKTKYKSPLSHLLNPGHTACAGCGMIIAARLILDTAGPNTIITNATGCSEVTTTQYPMTSYKHPWINRLFEKPSPFSSVILATDDGISNRLCIQGCL